MCVCLGGCAFRGREGVCFPGGGCASRGEGAGGVSQHPCEQKDRRLLKHNLAATTLRTVTIRMRKSKALPSVGYYTGQGQYGT